MASGPSAYAEFLKGKRVVLVGPAGYLAGRGEGTWIDSYDLVVRLNWGVPVPDQLKADYGSRTDILYKRLLKLGRLDHIDVRELQDAGVQWCVAVQRGMEKENLENLRSMLGGAIPYLVERETREQLARRVSTSPLVGLVAVVHLLKHNVASLMVTGCDFYQTGYHDGYGGRVYRESMGRKEGSISPRHQADPQMRHLHQLQRKDVRLQFDDRLSDIVLQATRREVTQGAAVIIPARYRSSRFPGKPLTKIAGKPMILHVCERAARAVERVVVATDDQRIVRVVERAGFQAVITGECLTGTDRVAEVARKVKAQVYVSVQGDEPLVEPSDILAILEAKRKYPKAVVNGMTRLTGDPEDQSAVKAVVSGKGRLIYTSRQPVPTEWRQAGLYAFTRADLDAFAGYGRRAPIEEAEDVEILRFLELRTPVQMVEVQGCARSVDLPGHIEAVEALMDPESVVAA